MTHPSRQDRGSYANTLVIVAGRGVRVDLAERILGFVLRPRGRAIPPGVHRGVDPSYSAFGWPSEPVIFKFETYSVEDEPLGKYVGTADQTTHCFIDGRSVDLDEFLATIGEQHNEVRATVEAPGKIAVFELLGDDAT
jgi:hypothetical protein